MHPHVWIRPVRAAGIAMLALLGAYFAILTLVSGWGFAREQFGDYWYFVVALAAGFGVQIGLYTYLRQVTRHTSASGGVVAVSGATSTGAMIACCAHYVANVLPVLATTGIVALVAQYQVQLFWVGLAFNLAGVLYVGNKAMQASRHMTLMGTQT